MPDNYNVDQNWGAQALDYNEAVEQARFSVVSGCNVTINTGGLGTGNGAIDVGGGTAIFNGDPLSVTPRTLDVETGDNVYPRKDIVYVDANGDPQIRQGQSEPAEPAGEVGPDTERPAPPSFKDDDVVILYEIWIPEEAQDIDAGNLSDRRIDAKAGYGDLTATESFTDPSGTIHTGELADIDFLDETIVRKDSIAVNGADTETFDDATLNVDTQTIENGEWGTWTVSTPSGTTFDTTNVHLASRTYAGETRDRVVVLESAYELISPDLNNAQNLEDYCWGHGEVYLAADVGGFVDQGETLSIQVSDDNGSTWTTVDFYQEPSSQTDHDMPWNRVMIAVTPYVTPGSPFQVTFNALAKGGQDEFAIENVRLEHAPTLSPWVSRDTPNSLKYPGPVEIPELIDGSGTSHTGELADVSDIPDSSDYVTDAELEDTAYQQETRLVDNASSSSQYFKIATLGQGNVKSRLRAEFTTPHNATSTRGFELYALANGTNPGNQWRQWGDGTDRLYPVVTQDSSGDCHLYVHAPSFVKARIEFIWPDDFIGGFDFTTGLAEADLTGSIVFDGAQTGPNLTSHFGDLTIGGQPVATESYADSSGSVDNTNISPSGLEVDGFNVIDVAQRGYPGDRSGGDLTTLFNNNPNSLFILRPGATYEMSTYVNRSYDFFGLWCPTAGNRPRIYPAEASRDSTGAAQQVEFLDLGGTGTSDHAGHTRVENVVFHNEASVTTNGYRHDCGLLKASFHETAVFKNVKYEGARQKLENDGTGGVIEHGSRYQIKAEGRTDNADVVFDQLHMPDGGTEASNNGVATGHAIGFAVEEHYGSLTIKNSYIKDFVDNGLYITHDIGPVEDSGKITVQNCHLENCSNSNLRIGPNTNVINCRINLRGTATNTYQGIGLHCQDPYNSRVDGLHFNVQNHPNDVIRVNSQTNHVYLGGVQISNDTSNRVAEISGPADQANGRVVLEHWKVQDSGSDNSYNSFMEFTGNRDDIIVRDCRLHTSTRGCIRTRGGMTVENCNFYTGSNYPALRIGAYDSNTDPGADSVIKFHDNKIANGNALGFESWAVVGTLDIQRNNFNDASSVFGAPSADFAGEVTNFVCKNNDGLTSGEPPSTCHVRGRPDTDAPNPVIDRPMPYAHTFRGDTVYDTSISMLIKNDGGVWRNVRNNTDAGTVEDAESGDISAWTTQSNMSVSSATVKQGSNSILFDGLNSTSGHNVSQLGDGLAHYPQVGDKFQIWVYPTDFDTIQFYFAVQSVGNGSEAYTFTLDFANSDFMLEEKGGSGSAVLIDQPVTNGYTANQWYQIVCEWRDDGSDQIYGELNDNSGTTLASATGTLSLYPNRTSGGVGAFIGGAARCFMDDWRITP